MATQGQSPVHVEKGSTSSASTSDSSSPARNDNAPQGLMYSPDITLGCPVGTSRRWSSSDSDDEEVDLNETDVSDDAFSAKEGSQIGGPEDDDDGGNSTSPPISEDEDESPFSWTAKRKAVFYRILFKKNFNPVGPQRHFCMVGIREKFCKIIRKEVETEVLWDHLRSLYNFKEMAKYYREKTPVEEFMLPPSLQKQAIEYSQSKAAEEEDRASN